MNAELILSKRPIEMIVPAAVGSNIDVPARLIADEAQSFLGDTIRIS